MNAPLIWIVFPFIVSLVLWFLHEYRRLTLILGSLVSFILVVLAVVLPIAEIVKIGSITFELSSTMLVLGRRFVLQNGDRSLLILLYGFGFFWFLGTAAIKSRREFVPFGLAMIVLAVAALSVQPFLYAALMIEIIVLLSIALLVPPGENAGKGELRFLIFQTMAMVFILLAGWAASGVEANPADEPLLVRTVVLLGLGFAFLLAVFPFHSWIIMLTSEERPFVAGFVINLISLVSLLLLLNFLNGFAWLREYPLLARSLRFTGLVMVLIGGIWAAFQKNFERMFGYALLLESGFALMSISLLNASGWKSFTTMIPPRILAFATWSLVLMIFGKAQSGKALDFTGKIRSYPVASLGLIAASLSIGGLPLLASFPSRLPLTLELAKSAPLEIVAVVLGNIFFLIGIFRMISKMIQPVAENWTSQENWTQRIYLSLGILIMLGFGIFPEVFLVNLLNLFTAFPNLF